MPLGVLLAGCGMALVGVAPSYPLILLCVVLSGIGVAAFHPEAARFANYVSGSGRARGMSFFSVGGNAGFALGPALTTPLVILSGCREPCSSPCPPSRWPPCCSTSCRGCSGSSPRRSRAKGETEADAPEHWGPFVRMIGVVTYGPSSTSGSLPSSPPTTSACSTCPRPLGNTALTLMLFGGAAGTLMMGPLADRFGRRTVVRASMLVLPPLIYCFTLAGPFSVWRCSSSSARPPWGHSALRSLWDRSTCQGASGSRPA